MTGPWTYLLWWGEVFYFKIYILSLSFSYFLKKLSFPISINDPTRQILLSKLSA